MTKKPNSATILILMISSYLLLIVFLKLWIGKEFHSEEQSLHKELTSNFEDVFNMQVDTLILEEIIHPTLNDSTFFEFSFNKRNRWSSNDSTSINIVIKNGEDLPVQTKQDTLKIITIESNGEGSDNQATIDIQQLIKDKDKLFEKRDTGNFKEFFENGYEYSVMENSPELDSFFDDISSSIEITEDEMMLKSVKMFVHHTSNNFDFEESAHMLVPIDSARLISNLSQLMKEQAIASDLYWKKEKVNANKSLSLIITEKSGPVLYATNYQFHLLKQLLPEILFAIFLLILTGSALLLAWKSLKQQMRLNTLRNDFMANISHELKTPVSTVKVALEAIRMYNREKDTAKTEEYLGMAVAENDRLENLLDKVLHLSIYEDEAMPLQKQDTDLKMLIQGMVDKLSLSLSAAKAKIECSFPTEECIVNADPVYIESVLRNLIDNSLKYGGTIVKVTLSFRNKNNIILSVADNGPGIPKQYIGQVFDKFFRVPVGDKHDVKGYGLGLYFAARVMESHDGNITVKNLPEGGCAFDLQFKNVYED